MAEWWTWAVSHAIATLATVVERPGAAVILVAFGAALGWSVARTLKP